MMFGIFKPNKQELLDAATATADALTGSVNLLFSFVNNENKYEHFFLAGYAFIKNVIQPLSVDRRAILNLFDNVMSQIPLRNPSVNQRLFFDKYSNFVNRYLAPEFSTLTDDEKILMQWGAVWCSDEVKTAYLSSYFSSDETLPETIKYISELERKYLQK